jgi:hypothetical protein
MEQLDWVFAHDDPEVVLRFVVEPVGIDKLVARGCLERVPFVDVAVHEHGPFVVGFRPALIERLKPGGRAIGERGRRSA